MDLTSAEAVADIIDAETAEAAKNAAGQLGGAIGRRIDKIYDFLTDLSSHYHAVLDYPDEDIEDFTLVAYKAELHAAIAELKRLADSYSGGKLLHGGIPAAIIGRPNAGKSSLLNAVLGYDRAIVTENENMIANAKLRIADELVGEFLHSMKTLGCTRDEVIALIQGAKEEEE